MPRSSALRFLAPVLLAGCTLVSGVANLTIGDEELGGVADGSTTDIVMTDATFADAPSESPPKKPQRDAAEPEEEDAEAPTDAAVDQDGGSGEVTLTFTGTLASKQSKAYGPFRSTPGTRFEARTTGSGDPDLYLRFGSPPTTNNADCSAESDDATELCRRTVPSGDQDAHVLVYGWSSCSYTLTIKYVPAP